MSRIRYIKPEFFLHEGLAELPFAHRLMFIGLWTIADREGRLEDRPKRIKAALFPYDDCDADAVLSDLDAAGFIQRYSVEDAGFIAIPGFLKHQRPHPKETSCGFPAPPSRENKRQAVKINGKQEMEISSRGISSTCRVEKGDGDGDGEERIAAVAAPTQLKLTADDPTPPAAKKPAAKREANPRHGATIALFVRLWSEVRGGTYRLAGAKDGTAVKRLLAYPEATDAEIESRIRRAMADQWFRQNGSLATFVSQWSKWEAPKPAPLYAADPDVNASWPLADPDVYEKQLAEADARHMARLAAEEATRGAE